ncbi:hypothetical protein F5050DRAFT_1715816 [Lentinula boryana]|uniref:Secreted protein n=1 Tax=Lentinula boryana TaxID=40481 RepID=A0ABQ8PZ80_9AGAR|nr:hypothetical protein F5050DRAFT_1715816 [Lentinula boryana]
MHLKVYFVILFELLCAVYYTAARPVSGSEVAPPPKVDPRAPWIALVKFHHVRSEQLDGETESMIRFRITKSIQAAAARGASLPVSFEKTGVPDFLKDEIGFDVTWSSAKHSYTTEGQVVVMRPVRRTPYWVVKLNAVPPGVHTPGRTDVKTPAISINDIPVTCRRLGSNSGLLKDWVSTFSFDLQIYNDHSEQVPGL